jgi:DNA (cytosine-5)-methyltransferase 1
MKLNFVDLFCGIGGIRLGLQDILNDCILSCDLDKFCRATYSANFNETPLGDIQDIDIKSINNFDCLLAGFPCQPFSYAGLKKGFADTRGTLFFNVLQILKQKRPQIVFLENVKGLLSHDKGKTFQVIKQELDSLGYHVHYKILNAKDFGVPQNRERVYIIGFLDKVDFCFPEPSNTTTKLGDILEKEVDSKYTISDKLWFGHQRRKEAHKAKGNGFGYSIFDASSKCTSTISARYYKDGSEILIKQKEKNPRKLTPREAARLQGFSDSFQIVVSDTQAYKQFGNTVAIPVIRAIANAIKKA